MKHHQFNKRITNISNDNFASISAKTLKPLLASSVPLLLAIFSVVYALPTHATATLSISVNKTSESLEIIPTAGTSTFSESGTITAYVATTNYTGYKLTITGPNEDGKLVGEDENNILPTIEGELSKEAFSNVEDTTYDNTWGFLPSKLNGAINTNYQPSPLSTTATTIDTTSAADNNTYDFSIAVKVNTSLAKDSYSGNFTLALTANPAAYQITYDGNGATSDVPEQQGGDFSSGTTIAISDTIPVKSGYTFKGWCTSTITNDACDGVTITSENNEFTFANITDVALNQITLTALWERATFYMQNVDVWGDTLNSGDSATAIDTRDGKGYTVARLADGKIWMTQNLDYVITSTPLTPDDSDVTSNWTPSSTAYTANSFTLSGVSPSSLEGGEIYYYTSGSTSNDTAYTSLSDCVGAGHTEADCKHYHMGNYYNWTAAIARNDSSDLKTNYTTAPDSICPKGWRLPVSASSGTFGENDTEFAYLLLQSGIIGAYPSSITGAVSYATNGFNKMRTSPLYFVRAGRVHGNVGERGYYWSSSVSDSTYAYRIYYNNSSVTPASNTSDRWNGFPIRCVAR